MRSHDGKPNGGRSLAIVTGASSGIGFYLAKECADNGYDLLIAADSTELEEAAEKLRSFGVNVQTVETDLATTEGVEELYEATNGRSVDILMFVGACDRRFQIHPAAMQRAGRAAAGFRVSFSNTASFALQCSRKARALVRVIAE